MVGRFDGCTSSKLKVDARTSRFTWEKQPESLFQPYFHLVEPWTRERTVKEEGGGVEKQKGF